LPRPQRSNSRIRSVAGSPGRTSTASATARSADSAWKPIASALKYVTPGPEVDHDHRRWQLRRLTDARHRPARTASTRQTYGEGHVVDESASPGPHSSSFPRQASWLVRGGAPPPDVGMRDAIIDWRGPVACRRLARSRAHEVTSEKTGRGAGVRRSGSCNARHEPRTPRGRRPGHHQEASMHRRGLLRSAAATAAPQARR